MAAQPASAAAGLGQEERLRALLAENARLRAQLRRRQRWLAATAEITNVLLGEVNRTAALRLVADRAREVAGADLALVMVYDEAGDALTVEVAAGTVHPGVVGCRVRGSCGDFGPVLTQRHRAVVADLGTACEWPVAVRTGTALLVPLAAGGETLGALALACRPGSTAKAGDPDIAMVETFAGQAALALERSRAQDEREMLAVLGDRERIARDLHDVVIQRLFAAGMQLQGAARHVGRPEVGARIDGVVDDLDSTIRDIREAIFELRSSDRGDLRHAIRALLDEVRAPLGFRPHLTLAGPLDTVIPETLRPVVLAVLREALSNVARHARAGAVDVSVRLDDHQLALTVTDDGVGIDGARYQRADRATGGLYNMRRRAEELGGGFTIGPARPRGSVLTWSAPV
jgi:signal transduction histidine kinase